MNDKVFVLWSVIKGDGAAFPVPLQNEKDVISYLCMRQTEGVYYKVAAIYVYDQFGRTAKLTLKLQDGVLRLVPAVDGEGAFYNRQEAVKGVS